MKRDMDLIRKVLLKVEALDTHSGRRVAVEASDPEFEIPDALKH